MGVVKNQEIQSALWWTKEDTTSLIHSTNNYGICYVPGAVLDAGGKEMNIIDDVLPLEELRELRNMSKNPWVLSSWPGTEGPSGADTTLPV